MNRKRIIWRPPEESRVPPTDRMVESYERFRKLEIFRGTRAARSVQIEINTTLHEIGAVGVTKVFGNSRWIAIHPGLALEPNIVEESLVLLHEMVHLSGIHDHRQRFKDTFVMATIEAFPKIRKFLPQKLPEGISKRPYREMDGIVYDALSQVLTPWRHRKKKGRRKKVSGEKR